MKRALWKPEPTLGNEVWVVTEEGGAGLDDVAYAVALDGLGNVFFTEEPALSGGGKDYNTVKVAADSTVLWICA